MKSCKGCIHEQIKGKPWWSTSPHPCSGCERINALTDNYTPHLVVKEHNEIKGGE